MLTRESQCLRLSGIALIVGTMVAFAWYDETVDSVRVWRSGDASSILGLGIVWFGLANVFTLGVVLLLAGMRQLSLVSNAAARRGALARILAANLMLLCFLFVFLDDHRIFGEDAYESWYTIPAIVGFVLIARASFLLMRSGWKYEARSAAEALAADPRPPVLYLRSFAVDDQILAPALGLGGHIRAALAYTASVSPEQEMAFILEGIGPVVAIGRPGERLPQLGAARLYVDDDEWRDTVGKLMNDAALIVIRAGETESLWWEVEQVMARCRRERVIIVAIGAPGTLPQFETRFAETFGTPVSRAPPSHSTLGRLLTRYFNPWARGAGKIIYFGPAGEPREYALTPRLTWSGAVLGPYRPWRDTLQHGFRGVFDELGLRWMPKRSPTAAVLLAIFGGVLGLHHFYVGRRRRGAWYLGFFWLVIPMFLGWIDAVRLALLDNGEFQALVKAPADTQRVCS